MRIYCKKPLPVKKRNIFCGELTDTSQEGIFCFRAGSYKELLNSKKAKEITALAAQYPGVPSVEDGDEKLKKATLNKNVSSDKKYTEAELKKMSIENLRNLAGNYYTDIEDDCKKSELIELILDVEDL